MSSYTEEYKIPAEEGKLLLENTNWTSVGETTNGQVYWNKETGEILFEGYGFPITYYEFRKKLN